jgi:agmatine/peptidylarginine deiminase
MGGIYKEIKAPERLVCTERFDESWYPGEAVDTLVLTEQGGKTTLNMTVRYESQEARDTALKSNMDVLNKFAKKGDIEVVEMPMPAKQVKADLRTPATYMNFLILNDAVLAPVFLDKHDDKAGVGAGAR